MITTNILLFILSCAVLVYSGSWLVKSLTRISSALKISEFTSGFIILAFATSVPELFVGISSALKHNTAIALGTVIGSNIANLTIMIGIPILLAKKIKIQSWKTVVDAMYMVGFAALPLGLMLLGRELSRIDGIILVTVFFVYIIRLWKQREVFTKKFEEYQTNKKKLFIYTLLFLVSLVVLFKSSDFVVHYATLISADLNLAPILIGLFLIAIGTSLPELVAGSQAVLKGHSEMGLGNIIGSVIANSTLVLGITAIIYPITSDFLLFITSGVYMIIICFIFATFIGTRMLHWKEGISLILLYVFFIIIEFYVKLV